MPEARSTRTRRKTGEPAPVSVHPLGTPTKGVSPNTGPLATALWLVSRGLVPDRERWYVQVTIGTAEPVGNESEATLLRVELFSEEWGFWFGHLGKVSWIRVTDMPFVHGRDEHELLGETPALKNIGALVRALELRFGIRFVRHSGLIRTSLSGADAAIREWLASL